MRGTRWLVKGTRTLKTTHATLLVYQKYHFVVSLKELLCPFFFSVVCVKSGRVIYH
jgi:hypothetical protein